MIHPNEYLYTLIIFFYTLVIFDTPWWFLICRCNPVWVQVRTGSIPTGFNSLRVQFRAGSIPCGFNSERVQFIAGTIPYFNSKLTNMVMFFYITPALFAFHENLWWHCQDYLKIPCKHRVALSIQENTM